jgi:hypothetical protein
MPAAPAGTHEMSPVKTNHTPRFLRFNLHASATLHAEFAAIVLRVTFSVYLKPQRNIARKPFQFLQRVLFLEVPSRDRPGFVFITQG